MFYKILLGPISKFDKNSNHTIWISDHELFCMRELPSLFLILPYLNIPLKKKVYVCQIIFYQLPSPYLPFYSLRTFQSQTL